MLINMATHHDDIQVTRSNYTFSALKAEVLCTVYLAEAFI